MPAKWMTSRCDVTTILLDQQIRIGLFRICAMILRNISDIFWHDSHLFPTCVKPVSDPFLTFCASLTNLFRTCFQLVSDLFLTYFLSVSDFSDLILFYFWPLLTCFWPVDLFLNCFVFDLVSTSPLLDCRDTGCSILSWINPKLFGPFCHNLLRGPKRTCPTSKPWAPAGLLLLSFSNNQFNTASYTATDKNLWEIVSCELRRICVVYKLYTVNWSTINGQKYQS